MSRERDLLFQLAEQRPSTGTETLSDDLLERYAEDRLTVAERRRVRGILAGSPEARRRLLELRGVDPPGPSPRLRRRVLESLAAGDRRRRPPWLPAAAALAAAALAAALGWRLLAPEPLPPGLAYDLRVVGIATDRLAAAPEGVTRAAPETLLRFEVTPAREPVGNVAFGLYRRVGADCLRISAPEPLTVETHRGSAVMTGRARDLLGDRPGRHALWVVVARPRDLPPRVTVGAGETARAALAGEGRRLVYEHAVELVAGTG